MTMLFFWVMTPSRLVGRTQRFGETYCHHLQGPESTRRHSPEEQHRYPWRPENLKSQKFWNFLLVPVFYVTYQFLYDEPYFLVNF
jgi:hypothetical protein